MIAAARHAAGWLLALGVLMSAVARAAAPATGHRPENRNALWTQIHTQCLPNAEQGIFPPAPCIDVELGRDGYAVFKDRNGRYQYLLLPLARITGIESPALLTPDATNYLADAWTARLYVEAALHASQPRDVVSLAVNSSAGRSQDQLHIHIDCIRGDVLDAIRHWLPGITQAWRPLPQGLPPQGHRYIAKWVDGPSLRGNPFKDLAGALAPGDALGLHSMLVIGMYSSTGQPGFVWLSGRVDDAHGDRAHAEELQDPTCAVAHRSP